MLRTFPSAVLLVALLVGQSSLVQLAAWGAMLGSRGLSQGWDAAVATTFDGRHPCGICSFARAIDPLAAPGPRDPQAAMTSAAAGKAMWLIADDAVVVPSAGLARALMLVEPPPVLRGRAPEPAVPPPRPLT